VRIRSPGACSRVATLRESEDCACRGLDACCNPFGGGRTAPKPGLISGAATPRAKSAVATSEDGSRPSRGTGLRPDASACLGRASLGGRGETVPPQGGACEDSADSRRANRASFGRSGTSAVQNANVRPRPLSGGVATRGCAATAPATPLCGTAPLGVSARRQLRSGGRRVWARVRHGIKSSCLKCCAARKGGYAGRRERVPAATLEAHRIV
jgi:hypothetical protein